MLQSEFSNWSGTPETYKEHMYNMYTHGYGYFGMASVDTFLGWSAYKDGDGWTFVMKKSYNHNLIFNIKN